MRPETSGAVRHILTAIGAAMVALGWITPEAVEVLVGNVMAIIVPFVGVVLTIVPFYLSYRAKKATSAEAKMIAAKVVVANVPIGNEISDEKAKLKATVEPT